jgi:hypothetical protein
MGPGVSYGIKPSGNDGGGPKRFEYLGLGLVCGPAKNIVFAIKELVDRCP